MSTASHQARETLKQEKKSGTLINGSGRDKTESVIFLDNGSVIASPYTVNKIINDIARANAKDPHPRRTNETAQVRVYDAITVNNEELFDQPEDDSAEE